MTNEVKQSIITRFKKKFSNYDSSEPLVCRVGLVEQFLIEIAEESEKRTIEKVANWIRENYIDADIVAGLPEAIERMKYES